MTNEKKAAGPPYHLNTDFKRNFISSALGSFVVGILFIAFGFLTKDSIIKMLAGVPMSYIHSIMIASEKTDFFVETQGQILRDDFGRWEKEVLRKKVKINQESILDVTAGAIGKYKTGIMSAAGGVDIEITINEIVKRGNQVFVKECLYKNESKTIMASTHYKEKLGPGDYIVKVAAVYYGCVEMYETSMQGTIRWRELVPFMEHTKKTEPNIN
jgi:hypothetical protein